ncbi:Transcriptional regulatory protein UhpA [Corynebacterium occultum]|uniref:Transcriptional regulatory protein UhpA n=1 Tax=Corynebacterium occultum TaxID=2675219 RepID=A0A6B8WAS6_9CORY|nr:response regulator transcription factor [Corynebacterium occultum]QGU08395.1 Transcriptional regulatory protein UhpA [Corynebacterium occultum]
MIHLSITDDEALVASSLATLLSLEDDLEVLTVCGSGEEMLAWWQRTETTGGQLPDVCVLDLQLGGIDGIDTAIKLRESTSDLPVLIVTSHARPRQLKRALSAGVQGFLPKTATAAEFATAIRSVYAGRRYIDPELAALTISSGESPLTPREEELLLLAGRGGSVEEIAAQTHLAPGTTRNYLSQAMSKLGAQNRFEAYTRARELGWL